MMDMITSSCSSRLSSSHPHQMQREQTFVCAFLHDELMVTVYLPVLYWLAVEIAINGGNAEWIGEMRFRKFNCIKE